MILIKKINSALIQHKEKFNKAIPFVLLCYFLCVFAPHFTVISRQVPFLFSLFTGSYQLFYRGGVAILFFIFMFVLLLANEIRIDRKHIFIVSLIFLFVFISPIINIPNYYLYTEYVTPFVNVLTKTTIEVGIKDIVSYYGEAITSILFLFSFTYIIPRSVSNESTFKLLPITFILLTSLCCIYSLIFEWKVYIDTINNINNPYLRDISSLFASKNQFGFTTFLSAVLCLFLLRFLPIEKGKKNTIFKILLITFCAVFSIFTILIMSMNSILALFSFLIVFAFMQFRHIKNKSSMIISMLAFFLTGLLVVILFLNVPLLKSTIIGNIFSSFFNAFLSRFYVSTLIFSVFKFQNVIFGFGPSLIYLQALVTASIGTAIVGDIHNSYITLLGSSGLFYLLFYLFLVVIIFEVILKQFQKRRNHVIILGLLISFLIYSLFESPYLFLSGASNTFLINLLVVCYPIYIYNIKLKGNVGNDYLPIRPATRVHKNSETMDEEKIDQLFMIKELIKRLMKGELQYE
jgi:hypothetical protein